MAAWPTAVSGAPPTTDTSALPACSEVSASATDDGAVVEPWQVVLDEDGAVAEHRLTLRHRGRDRTLHTGRRGFSQRAGAERLLIGERDADGTRLDMLDTSRACRLWTRRLARAAFPEAPETEDGTVSLAVHERKGHKFVGTLRLATETGATEALAETECLDGCLPHDGDITAAALAPAGAARPTPNFAAGGWVKDKALPFRWRAGAVPPSWARSAIKAGAEDARRTSLSRSPEFRYRSGAASLVGYTSALPAFCSQRAIACAGRALPISWAAWIRPHGTEYGWGTLRWCQKTSSASSCFDVRRVMLHELGHIVGLNHPSSAGFNLGSSDSIMQAVTPARPQAGASRHAFGRCDVATLQELYDTKDNKTAISTCNDVITKVTLAASRTSLPRGATVKLTARLRVDGRSAYRQLADNPLNGRSLKLKYRRAGSQDTWRTAWMRSLYSQGRYELSIAPGATWEFRAVFPSPSTEGLRYGRSDIVKVKVLD